MRRRSVTKFWSRTFKYSPNRELVGAHRELARALGQGPLVARPGRFRSIHKRSRDVRMGTKGKSKERLPARRKVNVQAAGKTHKAGPTADSRVDLERSPRISRRNEAPAGGLQVEDQSEEDRSRIKTEAPLMDDPAQSETAVMIVQHVVAGSSAAAPSTVAMEDWGAVRRTRSAADWLRTRRNMPSVMPVDCDRH